MMQIRVKELRKSCIEWKFSIKLLERPKKDGQTMIHMLLFKILSVASKVQLILSVAYRVPLQQIK